MRMNSLFDPNLSGTGHQPYGFDQYAALYSRYKVARVHVNIFFTTPGGAYDMACLVSVQPPQNSMSLANTHFAYLAERPEIHLRHLSTTGSRLATFQSSFDIGALSGLTKTEFESNVEDFQALVSANPSRSPTIHVAACGMSGGLSQTSLCVIELTFEGEFFDLIGQNPS